MPLHRLKIFVSNQQSMQYMLKWLFLAILIGACSGSASAWFLMLLDWATNYRESHAWIILLLPIIGIAIAAMYHYWGDDVVKGNNQLIEEVDNPQKTIPLKMAPMVLVGTVLTHLFGGSAGREGTAVQMGGSIADQFTRLFRLNSDDRKIIIISGISAGFASIFGTPLAGAVFGLEVLTVGRVRYNAILPALFSALVANYVCNLWPITHTHYHIDLVPVMNIPNLGWAILAGICFGLASKTFSQLMQTSGSYFKTWVKKPLFRPFVGGTIVVLFVFVTGSTKFIGLGIPTILESFTVQQDMYVFAIKILLTVITLSAGFKGGEVTPLFFIGATLGSALSILLPLPVGLLAGMGFVAVFAGAANTPIACILMGIELFGVESGLYIAVACVIAFIFSGHTGIYTSQIIKEPKHQKFQFDINKRINQI